MSGEVDPVADEGTPAAAAVDKPAANETNALGGSETPVAETNNSNDDPAKAEDDDDDDDLFGDSPNNDNSEQQEQPAAAAVAPPASGPSATSESPTKTASPASLTSIPRKSNASSPSQPPLPLSPSAASSSSKSLDLPPGCKVPNSVTSAILNGKLLETLKSLPVNLINDALQEYDDAVDVKGASIRNHAAYLYGVVKRYISVNERAQSGEGSNILPMGETLTPFILEKLEKLVNSKFCTREEMNDKVKSKIRMLSEKDALSALEELMSVDRSSIRNFGSYFMGILNRYMRGETSSKGRPTQPPPSQQQQQQRGRDRLYRDSASAHSHQPDRDRSRDRYDSVQPPYGNQQQQQQQPQFAYDGRPTAYARPGVPWQQQHQPHNSMLPNDHPSVVTNQYAPSSMAPPMQQSHMYSVHQQPPQPNNMFVPPPPPPPQQQQQGGNMMMQPHQQQQGGNNMMMQPHQQQQGQHPAYFQNPNIMNPISGQQQQQPPPYHNMQPMPPSHMNAQQSYQQPQQQQQNYGGPVMNSNPKSISNGSMPGAYPMAQGGWQQQQQQNPAFSVDILGLAEKAASALASQNKGMMQPPPHNMMAHTMNHPYHGAPSNMMQQQMLPGLYGGNVGGHNQSYGSQPSQYMPTGGGDAPFKRRTQASFEELPMSVRFAVENIQAMNIVDGPLDPGMLGMIYDLPEPLALGALQRFSEIDKNGVRNKTAYLAGLLRRELEKINRR